MNLVAHDDSHGGTSGFFGPSCSLPGQVIPLAGSVVVMVLHVDVISDVICPWCFIGKRRLEKAVAVLEGQHEVRVRWLPFQLNPAMPREGLSRREYRTRKFGSWERSLALAARVIEVGKSESIPFAFDRI